jgi:hypothetical protein
MPVTVTASDGESYHVWQLPALTTPEPSDETEYSRVQNELTDGHRSSIQSGFDAGTKRWKLTAPTLASLEVLPNTVTDVNGASVSREEYLWSLYDHTQVTGLPFVYPFDGVNYFATFEDEDLTMQRMKVKIYTVGITLKQVRLAGVTL